MARKKTAPVRAAPLGVTVPVMKTTAVSPKISKPVRPDDPRLAAAFDMKQLDDEYESVMPEVNRIKREAGSIDTDCGGGQCTNWSAVTDRQILYAKAEDIARKARVKLHEGRRMVQEEIDYLNGKRACVTCNHGIELQKTVEARLSTKNGIPMVYPVYDSD